MCIFLCVTNVVHDSFSMILSIGYWLYKLKFNFISVLIKSVKTYYLVVKKKVIALFAHQKIKLIKWAEGCSFSLPLSLILSLYFNHVRWTMGIRVGNLFNIIQYHNFWWLYFTSYSINFRFSSHYYYAVKMPIRRDQKHYFFFQSSCHLKLKKKKI